MYELRTIEEVVAYQLRRLRGENSQTDMADLLGIPLRTYNALENGQIPRPETRKLIAEKLKITETELFLDPDLTKPTDEQILARITEKFAEKPLAAIAAPDPLAGLDEKHRAAALRQIDILRKQQCLSAMKGEKGSG